MDLQEFFEVVEKEGRIEAMSEALFFSDEMTGRALTFMDRINHGGVSREEVRELVGELTQETIPENTVILPPFYTDFGLNTVIGEGVYINMGCTFQDQGGIRIGNGVQIGHQVRILTVNHEEDPDHRGDLLLSPVVIEDKVWIGSGAVLLPGVTIGEGAIIGAGAVVTRDIPAGVMAAGVPARVIRKLGEKGAHMPAPVQPREEKEETKIQRAERFLKELQLRQKEAHLEMVYKLQIRDDIMNLDKAIRKAKKRPSEKTAKELDTVMIRVRTTAENILEYKFE